jgi:vacuolar-type H+-ATPase subunit H
MATRSDNTRETVNEAASEAMRATSEASRRALQGAQDVIRATSGYLAQATEANRKLFQSCAQGGEATLKGGFEVQNAVFAAGQSVLDASNKSSRDVLQQWTEIAHEAQQATLDLWQAGVGAGDKMLGSAASGEMAGQDDRGRRR